MTKKKLNPDKAANPSTDSKGSPQADSSLRQPVPRNFNDGERSINRAGRELRRAQEALEVLRVRYFDLYDLAPVGYFVLSEQGLILEANLKAAALLGEERRALVKKAITCFILPEDQDIYYRHRKALFETGAPQICELRMARKDGAFFWARVEAAAAQDAEGGPGCRAVISDITERKRAEMLLQESRVQYEAIFETTGTATLLVEEDTSIIMANQECLPVTGYSPKELMGTKWPKYVAPESLEIMLKYHNLRRGESGKAPHKYEVKLVNKAGQIRHVVMDIAMIPSTKRSVVSMLDITERKRSEESLRDAEMRYRTLADSGQALIWSSGLDKKCDYFNLPWLRFTGRTLEQELGDGWAEGVHPDDLARCIEIYSGAFDRRENFSMEYRLHCHDGSFRWIQDDGTPRYDSWGNFLGYIGHCLDVADRKRAEEELTHSHDLASYIIEYNRSAIAVHDRDLKYVFVSRRYLQDYNVKEQDVIGKHHYDVFPDLPQKWRDVHQKALAGEISSAEDDPYVREDGTVEWTRWECRPWYEADGSIGGIIIYTEVITERKRAEEEIRQKAKELLEKNDELNRFTYAVSHDLRSPLVTIQTFQGHLGQDLRSHDMAKVERDLDYIRIAADKMGCLLDELLRLSRAGRMMNPSEEVPLQEIVKEALDLVAGRITGRGIRVDLTKEPVVLTGDRTRLMEVFQNLVDNAAKFMGDNPAPRVEIGVEQVGEEMVLHVRDNGIGIDPELQPTVFGLFHKLDPGSEGTGIGLALVKRIVELHGGRIWVESEGPGKGTTFRFTLAKTRRGPR